MPPEKLKNCQITNPAAAALASCEDLMLCILARLPVKSICRFKSVCKPWNHLLSTQEFVKMQFKISNESKNQSFLVHRRNLYGSSPFSVFNIDSNENAKIDHPFDRINIVGCCRGLVCIKRDEEFVLWNPAMNLSKTLSPLKDPEIVSLGFGYDAEGDDFKVVRLILKFKRNFGMCVSCVKVYSVNSDSWTTIEPGFQFSKLKICRNSISAIVNGNPYWVGKIDVIKRDVLICFDMSKLVFKIVPLSSLDYNKAEHDIEFVDFNGSVGALVFTWKNRWHNEESVEYVDSWVFDDDEQIWAKSYSVGPIDQVKMKRVLRCLKDGRVLGVRPIEPGQMIVFNSETKYVKDLFNVGHEYFGIYDYTASLVYIEGMEKVKLKKRRDHWNKSKVFGVCLFSIMLIVSNLKYFRSSRTGKKH
ncbi:hypothetical protein CASFOL_027846 [Castilleja foliolosa]|uniref:F-box domain-containing protein n=1 Tax=Castilleja foliolosa TaxID=1961234 RepID=A0ABD3CFY8_9LAMI